MLLAFAAIATPAGAQRTVVIDRGAYTPAVSPDGSTIAVGIAGRIWLLPIGGGAARQLTSGHGWDHHPAWSPDGRRLAYVHDTPVGSEIVLHTFDTGTSRTLYGRPPTTEAGSRSWGVVYSFGRMAFHPTDGRLYFVDFRSGIHSVDPTDGRPPRDLLPGSGIRPGRPGISERSSFAFSPDGRSLVVERDTTGLWSHLHLTPLDSTRFTQLTRVDTAKRTHVQWHPDGSSLVYLELKGGRESLARLSTTTGEARRIELGAFADRELALHPDGAHAVLVAGRRLFLVRLETGAMSAIPFRAQLRLPARARADLVITNARLFDGTGAKVIEGATVAVRDGRVLTVTSGRYRGNSTARVIDARGRFLMPGLVESHNHLSPPGIFSQARVPQMGITSVFDPGSAAAETMNLRDAIEHGMLEGPRIYTSGPTLGGAEDRARALTIANLTDPADARMLVRELARMGVDAIKAYAFLKPEVLAAVVRAAHAVGLPVIGDLIATPWSRALDAGIDGFVHLMDHKWRFVAHEVPAASEGPWAVVAPDSALMNTFFANVAARGAMFDPTVIASSQYSRADSFAVALRRAEDGHGDGRDTTAAHRSAMRARTIADMLRTMHRHGVRWVAGTDDNASALFEELAIYEAIGIPNATILQTATLNAARWLKRDDFGTVQPGKRADLILVDGDPLTRIRDLRNVVLVVQRGRVVHER